MVDDQFHPLRVLIADQQRPSLQALADVVMSLGHEVIAREVGIAAVGPATARLQPDIALVELGESTDHALDLIRRIVHEAACPVIALLSTEEPEFVRRAARLGVFAYIVDSDSDDLQSAIEITLQRFAEFSALRGALGRRAVIEQAKGILMSRHDIDADAAFEMLRERSQRSGRKVGDLAAAIVDSHGLLSTPTPAEI